MTQQKVKNPWLTHMLTFSQWKYHNNHRNPTILPSSISHFICPIKESREDDWRHLVDVIAHREIGPWARMIRRKSQTMVGELWGVGFLHLLLIRKEWEGIPDPAMRTQTDLCLSEISGWNSVHLSFNISLSLKKLFEPVTSNTLRKKAFRFKKKAFRFKSYIRHKDTVLHWTKLEFGLLQCQFILNSPCVRELSPPSLLPSGHSLGQMRPYLVCLTQYTTFFRQQINQCFCSKWVNLPRDLTACKDHKSNFQ